MSSFVLCNPLIYSLLVFYLYICWLITSPKISVSIFVYPSLSLHMCIHTHTHTHTLWGSVHAQSLSHVSLFATPWVIGCQAPLYRGFSRQEYWSGLPFPPGDLPNLGTQSKPPALVGGFFTTEPPGSPNHEDGSSLFSLLIQIQFSSRNSLTNTSRNNVLPDIWASRRPGKMVKMSFIYWDFHSWIYFPLHFIFCVCQHLINSSIKILTYH